MYEKEMAGRKYDVRFCKHKWDKMRRHMKRRVEKCYRSVPLPDLRKAKDAFSASFDGICPSLKN